MFVRCGFCGMLIAQAVVRGDYRHYAVMLSDEDVFIVRGKAVVCCDTCLERNRRHDREREACDS